MARRVCGVVLCALAACSSNEATAPDVGGASGEDAGLPDARPTMQSRDGSSPPASGETCAEADVIATRRPLTVWIAMDDSIDLSQDSSNAQLGPAWGILRESLLGTDGVITKLDAAVRFGWIAVGIPQDGYCEQPKKTFVDPAFNNHAAINAAFAPAGDLGQNVSAPYYSFKHVLEHTRRTTPEERGKTVMFVARGPNNDYICHVDYLANYMLGDNPSGAGVAYRIGDQAIRDLVAEGVGVYAFASVPGFGNAWVDRVEQIAALGGTGRAPIDWREPDELRAQLLSLTSELIGCEFELNGSVKDGEECYGRVTVDGKLLPCNDANGWRMKGARTVELTGEACRELEQKPTARFAANFPCDAWVPLI